MRFVFDDVTTRTDLELSLEGPDACIADLAAALGVRSRGLAIDGRFTPGELGLFEAGLVEGCVVGPPESARRDGAAQAGGGAPGPGSAVLRIVGGLAAGDSLPLPPGRTIIGRGPAAGVIIDSREVSREHCLIEIGPAGTARVTDLGSSNGTDLGGARITGSAAVRPDDVLALGGGVLLRVLPAGSLPPPLPWDPIREAGQSGTVLFSRAPRPAEPGGEPPLRVPGAPRRAAKPTFSISAVLSPLLMAGATVLITREIAYAAIAGLTPVMFVANFVEERTRGRRSLRRSVRDFRGETEDFSRRLRGRRAAEIARRLAAAPDPAEMMFRVTAPARNLWERRPGTPGFLRLTTGFVNDRWQPPVAADAGEIAPEVQREIDAVSELPQVPAEVDLSGDGVIGLDGDRDACLAVARSLLCQAVAGSGPADLTVAVFADASRAAEWGWAKWLPHVLDRAGGGGSRLLAAGGPDSEALARTLLAASPAEPGRQDTAAAGPRLLIVVDGATLLEGRPCALRELLAGRGGPASGIVLTDRLPALCTATLAVGADGTAVLHRLTSGQTVPAVVATGMAERQALRLARNLARFEDPELRVEGAGLPDTVSLLPLLGLPEITGRALLARWSESARALRAAAVIGVSEDSTFAVDLDDDGPHGLIAGTTGSGKSELLRTLIASLACGNGPEHLTFALVDYKGGGALDECATLPHSVGLVTDLDEQLSERALRCLEAELRHREHLLRDAGLSHVTDYQRLRDTGRRDLEPMPRLVVVIDEFATLVKALPHFVDSLVSIAQRGRSLGIHLIMATQRPAGSVSDAIKNNVKLRIALRLESASDSVDVIDSPVAAGIGGRQRGRAFYRVSARETLPVQTALSTGPAVTARASAAVSLTPFRFGSGEPGPAAPGPAGPTDLQLIVGAAADAVGLAGLATPRRPWPDPLPAVVGPGDVAGPAARGLLGEASGLPVLAVADDPDRQDQYSVGWDPAAGNLLVYGAAGYGTTSALASLALAVAGACSPADWHLFVLDLGAGQLAPLGRLAHTGAYIGPAEAERQARLVRLLRKELDDRKASGGARRPEWLVLIDNLGAFLADYGKDAAGQQLIESLERVYADGPTVGIRFAATADRSGAVPGPWAALTQQKLLLRLADTAEYGYFDVPRNAVPGPRPGRALITATHQVVQLVWPGDDLGAAVAAAVASWRGARRQAPSVGLLPATVRMSELGASARLPGDPAWIPVGLGDGTLQPVGLELYEHEHALIAGPPRSGRSTALCALAQAAARAPSSPAIVALAVRRSPLRDSTDVTRVVTDLSQVDGAVSSYGDRPVVLLVDDAESVDDPAGQLERLLKPAQANLTVVAAGRPDSLRRSFGHWTQKLRESRCGVLLTPDYDLDGDLLGVTLPRLSRLAPVPGRGFLAVGGSVAGVQVALPG